MEVDRLKRSYNLFKEDLEKYFYPADIINSLNNKNYEPITDKCLDAFLDLSTKYFRYKDNKINLLKLTKAISSDPYLINIVDKG